MSTWTERAQWIKPEVLWLPASYWPRPRHVPQSNCKGSWEMCSQLGVLRKRKTHSIGVTMCILELRMFGRETKWEGGLGVHLGLQNSVIKSAKATNQEKREPRDTPSFQESSFVFEGFWVLHSAGDTSPNVTWPFLSAFRSLCSNITSSARSLLTTLFQVYTTPSLCNLSDFPEVTL